MSEREQARDRLAAVEARIAVAAARAGRSPREITLVGVAKRQPLARIVATIEAGLRVLGENFVQEARDVREGVERAFAGDGERPAPPLEWRMVGRLQRNKLALAVRLFDVLESVDRIELVAPLARHAAEAGRIVDVLIQVNIGDEPQKGGVRLADAAALARAIGEAPSLRLRGFMAVPPASGDPEDSRPYFQRLRRWRDAWAAAEPGFARSASDLSLGMSNDFEVAIEEGATLVRVGTALFGQRVDPS